MRAGDELAGRYRLAKRLGRGGMSEVWAATDLSLDRSVAVKLLLANQADEAVAADEAYEVPAYLFTGLHAADVPAVVSSGWLVVSGGGSPIRHGWRLRKGPVDAHPNRLIRTAGPRRFLARPG